MDKFTQTQDGQRVCVPLDKMHNLAYPKYIFSVLTEVGFSYVAEDLFTGIEFVHNQDTDLKISLTLDINRNWYHLIGYKHSKWTLTYEGDVEYHIFGNDVLKTIRRAYQHWHGL